MDPILKNCPKCGHAVVADAGACTYCGEFISKEDPVGQPDEKIPEEEASSPGDASPVQLKAEPSVVELKQEIVEHPGDILPRVDDVLKEAEEQIEDKSKVENPHASSDPDILKTADDGPSESVTREPVNFELIEAEASKPEAGVPPASEALQPADQVPAAPQIDIEQDAPPADADDTAVEPVAEVETEIFEEAILLTPANEVQPLTTDTPTTVEVAAPMEAAGNTAEPYPAVSEAEAMPTVTKPEQLIQAESETEQQQSKVPVSADVLKIEKAAQDMAEALKKQKAMMAAESLKKQKATGTKAAVLKEQKDGQAKAQTLKKEKQIPAKTQVLKQKKAASVKTQALKKQKEAQADIDILKQEEAVGSVPNTADRHDMPYQGLEANTKIIGLLKKYEGQAIGINYDNSAEIREAELVEANDEFFSVFVREKELHYNYPLKTILTVIEGKDGVGGGALEQKGKFNVVIKVYPLALF